MSVLYGAQRVIALALFVWWGMLRSWAVLVILGGGAAFYSLAFKYALAAGQFRLVMGTWLGVLGAVGALLLANRADRAASQTLLARLPRRAELLGAIVLGAWLQALSVGAVLTAGAWLQDRVALGDVVVPSTLVTCALLPVAGAAIGLHLTRLVNRGGSQLLAYLLLIAVLLVADQRWLLEVGDYRRVVRVYDRLVWPLTMLLKGVGREVTLPNYLAAAALVVVGSGLLLGLAAALFRRKDLIWVE
jgi:hypothetical protein